MTILPYPQPHRCETCGHTFTTKYNLKEHENIHKAEKPYMCSVCGTGFADRNNLRRHEASHGNNSTAGAEATTFKRQKKQTAVAAVRPAVAASRADEVAVRGGALAGDSADKGVIAADGVSSKEDYLTCDFCLRLCSGLDELLRHQRACHCDSQARQQALECRACGAAYASREHLVEHVHHSHLSGALAVQQQQRMVAAAVIMKQQQEQQRRQSEEVPAKDKASDESSPLFRVPTAHVLAQEDAAVATPATALVMPWTRRPGEEEKSSHSATEDKPAQAVPIVVISDEEGGIGGSGSGSDDSAATSVAEAIRSRAFVQVS